MSERTDKVEPPVSGQPAGADGPLNTTSLSSPAGLQANATLNGRRLAVLSVNLVTWGLLLASFASLLSVGGWTWVDRILFVCFVFGTPWSVLGFWNAMIGLWLLAGGKARLADVAPFLAAADGKEPLAIRTAVLMTLRNEDPTRAILRLKTVKASLDATGEGQAFSYFILSDTSRDDVAADEQAIIAAWRAADPDGARIVYRRRTDNAGFKAGNVRDFCMRWGQDFELMLPLDADSLMTGAAIVRLVRIMQTHPRIGILQSLVVGTPSSSAFARIFQFGMRHGMRAYTMGQAWWVGDCGPYWGHNALVRIAPFVEHCDLPVLPGRPPLGGHVLSHDQVEATLMRRAGFEVRVMPVEDGSYEDNPPDALVFIGRDVRWCQGNMQYLKLLDLPDLKPISRFQLLWAILMFVGIPAWTLMIALLPLAALDAQAQADFPVTSAKLLYGVFLEMYLSPKIAGLIDAATTTGEIRRFGGALRFSVSAVIEIVFSFLQGAVTTIRTSLFMLGLPFGRSIIWSGQKRDSDGVSWREAFAALWPQLVFGLAVCGALLAISPTVLLWSLPLTAGYLLAIPFTVVTAYPPLGRFMRRHGIAGIPEDFAPPPEILAVEKAGGY
ncbi:MAG: glucans biosynthesis glucosyltransferase MdoH [Hyphomicrobium sp.]|nr:glucans biosynthesis glucosyltransferase MdoH [Hyphomicrobium sp.]